MSITGLTNSNYNFHTFQKHNAMLMLVNKEVYEGNEKRGLDELKQIVDIADTYYDPEYPNIEDPKLLYKLVELRFQHSKNLYFIHNAIHNRNHIKTKMWINKFQRVIGLLTQLYEEYGEDDIIDDIEKRRLELDGIQEIMNVLKNNNYWKKK